ncbi:hypothetical protein, partial [Streptomonospora nanhaiensis]
PLRAARRRPPNARVPASRPRSAAGPGVAAPTGIQDRSGINSALSETGAAPSLRRYSAGAAGRRRITA